MAAVFKKEQEHGSLNQRQCLLNTPWLHRPCCQVWRSVCRSTDGVLQPGLLWQEDRGAVWCPECVFGAGCLEGTRNKEGNMFSCVQRLWCILQLQTQLSKVNNSLVLHILCSLRQCFPQLVLMPSFLVFFLCFPALILLVEINASPQQMVIKFSKSLLMTH